MHVLSFKQVMVGRGCDGTHFQLHFCSASHNQIACRDFIGIGRDNLFKYINGSIGNESYIFLLWWSVSSTYEYITHWLINDGIHQCPLIIIHPPINNNLNHWMCPMYGFQEQMNNNYVLWKLILRDYRLLYPLDTLLFSLIRSC